MGIFTTIGTWLGATSTAAFATGVTATAAVAGATATTVGAMQKPQAPSITMPQVPQMGDAAKKAQDTMLLKKKAMARSKSIFTSPLGYEEEATTAKKTLLGR